MKLVPDALAADLRRARRLEYWTLFWMATVVAVMGFAAGGSQAMKTAWIEDMLGLVPSIVFLVALRMEQRGATRLYPYGHQRANSFAFLIAAVALAIFGLFLLYESAMALLRREHPTIPPIEIFGQTIWMGWVMIAALFYSMIPPVILGRKKLPLARRLCDKVLHTDAMMQRADWQTAAAGIAGILGVGFGLWWADAAAALVISGSIVLDGYKALLAASAELIDGMPRELDGTGVDEEADRLCDVLAARFPGADVRLRETGRYIRAQVTARPPDEAIDLEALWPGAPERAWRFSQLSFVPPSAEN